jgi:hypothetical protein
LGKVERRGRVEVYIYIYIIYHDKPKVQHRSVYETTAVKMSMRREEMAGGSRSLLGMGSAFDMWSEQDEGGERQ